MADSGCVKIIDTHQIYAEINCPIKNNWLENNRGHVSGLGKIRLLKPVKFIDRYLGGVDGIHCRRIESTEGEITTLRSVGNDEQVAKVPTHAAM